MEVKNKKKQTNTKTIFPNINKTTVLGFTISLEEKGIFSRGESTKAGVEFTISFFFLFHQHVWHCDSLCAILISSLYKPEIMI